MTPEEPTPKLEHLQETDRHNEVRVRAIRREIRFVVGELTRARAEHLASTVMALNSDLDLLREELLVAQTPLSTLRAPRRKPVAPEEATS